MPFSDLKTRKPNLEAYHAQRRADKKRSASMKKFNADKLRPKGVRQWERELKALASVLHDPLVEYRYGGRVYE